jgi:oxygen-independent coproporphyrinogen-3 oxidase
VFSSKNSASYLEVLKKELKWWSGFVENIDSIYFGGGTPTLLPVCSLQDIFKEILCLFNLVDGAEITIEANPDSLSEEKLEVYRSIGINRLSVGIQTMNPTELGLLGRVHSVQNSEQVLSLIRSQNWNFSVDLMLGIPGQTCFSLEDSLTKLMSYKPNHLSAYMLSVEPESRWYDDIQEGLVNLPDDELTVQMYDSLSDWLSNYGIKQYEISNYSLPGYESVHNTKYWMNDDCIGVGPSAGGWFERTRWKNGIGLNQWKAEVENRQPCQFFVKTSHESAILESIMLQFRMINGIYCSKLSQVESEFPTLRVLERVENLVKRGLLVSNENRVSLSKQGLLFANEVFQEFLD